MARASRVIPACMRIGPAWLGSLALCQCRGSMAQPHPQATVLHLVVHIQVVVPR